MPSRVPQGYIINQDNAYLGPNGINPCGVWIAKLGSIVAQVCPKYGLGSIGSFVARGPSSEKYQTNPHLGFKGLHVASKLWKSDQ